MKISINYYFLNLIKNNILYVAGFITIIVISLSLLPGAISEYKEITDKSATVRTDIQNLSDQDAVAFRYEPTEIKDLVGVADTLAPQQYTLFSVFETIDDIENRSGLEFLTYSSPTKGLSEGGISLDVEAQGAMPLILNFLKNYHTLSARAMEIDSVTFKPEKSTVFFTMRIHSRSSKPQPSVAKNVTDDTISLLRQFQAQGIGRVVDKTVAQNIPSKANPFSP